MGNEDIGILIVDDEFSVRDSLLNWFRKDGYRVGAAENGSEALRLLDQETWDVVLLDIKMPGMDGIEVQRRISETTPDTTVIMITAYGSVETAVQALKQGAYDYITKPIDPDNLSMTVGKAVEHRRLKTENIRLRQNIETLSRSDEIIGDSPQMHKVLELVRSVAQTDVAVLIRGESGTGKELIARAIHAGGPRHYFPLVAVNCGAVTESLLESELFGHEKGAFTGAQFQRKGRLELADRGTLFLDEVGSISARTQVDLLRALETKEFTRIGGSRPIRVDFRVVCATNQDLEQLMEEGRFRQDFYFRINVFRIDLPSLVQRRSDIPLLADHFLNKFALQMDKRFKEISSEAMDLLRNHLWPGNVRELANAIERAMVVGTPPAIKAEDLPFHSTDASTAPDGDSLADVEKAHVAAILQETEWNITRAARILRIDRATLYNKIKKYNLRK